MAARKILHLDLDAFFCAVEELRQPDLVGKAFAVGGRPEERGVVASCSYPARRCGVHSAMPMSRALRICPQLIIVPSNYTIYRHASEQVMAILRDVTPLLEQISIDEAFLDVSDLPGAGFDLARALQQRIYRETHLPCSLGIATNKLVAKMATDYGKASRRGIGAYPNAIFEVLPGEEAAFLKPLPAEALWGIGPKSAARLAGLGIHTVGDIAALPDRALRSLFGRMGYDLGQRARGIDDRKVVVEHAVKSISQEITFEHDIADQETLEGYLWRMTEQVGLRLRQEGYSGSTVRLKLRWPDFTTPTRQHSLAQPTDHDEVIYRVALELFHNLWMPGLAVRLLGVGVSGLGLRAHQPGLWDTQTEKDRKVQEVLDGLRARFGDRAIQRGRGFDRGGHSSETEG